MATVRSRDVICRIVEHGILVLETEAGYKPVYYGILKMQGMLVVVDWSERNLQVYNGHDGKLITSHRLESYPMDVCRISKNEVAVCLWDGTVVILSLKSIDDVKLVKTLQTGFDYGWHSLAKWNSDKLIISGKKRDGKDFMLCWGILSIRNGRIYSIHICEGYRTRMAVKDNTVYISCLTSDSINRGVHVYDILNPKRKKFLYQHQELNEPWSIMADRDYVYVCDRDSNRIHQLTDSGQLVTINTVSSRLDEIFYDDQQRLLYTTNIESNVITVYKMESLHKPDSVIPAEVLNMDTRSLQMYKEALNDGKEKVYNIRVMVVGQYGVGKTTLTQRLLGKNVNISERHSTDGIDVHVECSKVSLPAGEWTTQEKNAEQYFRLQRLVRLFNEHSHAQESKREQVRQSEMDDQVTIVEYDNRHTQHNPLVSKERNDEHPQHDQTISAEPSTNQKVKPPSSQPVESTNVRLGPEPSSGIDSKKNEKDTVMEILQLVSENSGNLEKDTVEYAALSLWDFAGQSVFYTTHQTFLTSRAIYLLVMDLSQNVTDLIKDDECFFDAKGKKVCKVHDLTEIWLNSIHSCAPSHSGIPPVILIGTHVDKIPEICSIRFVISPDVLPPLACSSQIRIKLTCLHNFGEQKWHTQERSTKAIDDYFMKIRQMLKRQAVVHHLMDNIAIDNTQFGPRLDYLKKRIFELASQQPHWGEEKPARWLPLEQAIMTIKASGVKVAPLSLIEKINRSSSIKIDNRDELVVFLCFQHDIGTILYFNDEGLREKVVLDPQWMIDALKSLITAKMFIVQNPSITNAWYAFEEEGELTDELIVLEGMSKTDIDIPLSQLCSYETDIDIPSSQLSSYDTDNAIWTKKEKPDFHDNKEYILLVMEKLNIIARPMSYTLDRKSVKKENYYLAPCILRQETPEKLICPKSVPGKESTSALCFVCKQKFLPPPIFHRLVGACLTHWPIAKQNKENLIYCGCCLFDIDNYHRLSLHFLGHVIFAHVTIMGVTDIRHSSKLCSEARKFIFENLLKIIGNLGQSLQFEPHIQCNHCDADSLKGMIDVPRLQKETVVVCHSHGQSHTLESRQLLKFWFKDGQQTAFEGKRRGKGFTVDKTGVVPETSGNKEKLHETVLNRCLPNLLKDLNVRDVMMYIQQKELFDAVTIRDINEQKTTTDKIRHLIDQIRKRDQDTYVRFKECLILAQRADLKIMLEEEEENIAAEMKEKHQDPSAPEQKRRAETAAQKKSKMCLLM